MRPGTSTIVNAGARLIEAYFQGAVADADQDEPDFDIDAMTVIAEIRHRLGDQPPVALTDEQYDRIVARVMDHLDHRGDAE